MVQHNCKVLHVGQFFLKNFYDFFENIDIKILLGAFDCPEDKFSLAVFRGKKL